MCKVMQLPHAVRSAIQPAYNPMHSSLHRVVFRASTMLHKAWHVACMHALRWQLRPQARTPGSCWQCRLWTVADSSSAKTTRYDQPGCAAACCSLAGSVTPAVAQHGQGGEAHPVGGGLGRIELAVQIAGELQEAALRAGDPQIGAAGVEDDAEQLRRRAQAYLAIVCARTRLSLHAG